MAVYLLSPEWPVFPDPEQAEESGLLAVGGSLSSEFLLNAYAKGIFPWYDQDQPILWWSPDPRAVFRPGEVKIAKSMRPYLKKYRLQIDAHFDQVIHLCRSVRRKDQPGTWLTDEMIQAYTNLHHLGYAHSFECWYQGKLAGGLYGVSLGKCFFGESMFSLISNASKFSLIRLSQILQDKGFQLIDCQIPNEHLNSMGCSNLPRKEFLPLLKKNLQETIAVGSWMDWAE